MERISTDDTIREIVVAGGGTAGWLSACLIAATAAAAKAPLTVTLVESPDVPTIGVGEGTWPTMRSTLKRIGIDEAEFLVACDATFKQGSRFDGWVTGAAGDRYHHPFMRPDNLPPRDLLAAWQSQAPDVEFAFAVCPQPTLCAAGRAPRLPAMEGYTGVLNYAYHLDAAKLASLLCQHGNVRLGIRHILDHVVGTECKENGDLAGLQTRKSGTVSGDFFLDCTGHAAALIKEHAPDDRVDCSHILFNDTALAVQVPVTPGSAIATETLATAHAAGWIWDIGLPSRRGVGCVYASEFMSEAAAMATLHQYLERTAPEIDLRQIPIRRLSFQSGYRTTLWRANCLAIGLSAGFVEPLEASAIVLIEMSLLQLIDNWPSTRSVMDAHARRFNEVFRFRWQRVTEFLKLHYVLSHRSEPYWRAHRNPESYPERLADLLTIWQHQPPSISDLPSANEMFPAASYQYVLYGMGFPPPAHGALHAAAKPCDLRKSVEDRIELLMGALPTSRAYLHALKIAGL